MTFWLCFIKDYRFTRVKSNLVKFTLFQAAERISSVEARFKAHLEHAISPIFGCELEQHLQRSRLRIALPIRNCVCRLLQIDICEEGLFRVAGSTHKTRRIASLMNTGEYTDDQLLEINDPHVFASILKLYLRELPTPILFPYVK